MTPALARRIVLALMDRPTFDLAADLGYTPAEIRRARRDRAGMKRRYSELKASRPFLASANAARVEWLTGLKKDDHG